MKVYEITMTRTDTETYRVTAESEDDARASFSERMGSRIAFDSSNWSLDTVSLVAESQES